MSFSVRDLETLGYLEAWDIQKQVAEDVLRGGEDQLLFVEHPPVLTLGASFHDSNLLRPILEYESQGIEVVRTDRGGDVTYHGPGQLVIYPIFNLERHGKDVHKWMRDLVESMLLTLAEFGIEGRRFPPHSGAWVRDSKVAAIGVKIRKWVSLHCLALNCNCDLEPFSQIIPCGIQGYGVCSLTSLSGAEISTADAKPVVVSAFRQVFDV